MPRKKNPNQEDNLTQKLMVRLSEKDMRDLKRLAEKEYIERSTLARKIILIYIKQQILDNE